MNLTGDRSTSDGLETACTARTMFARPCLALMVLVLAIVAGCKRQTTTTASSAQPAGNPTAEHPLPQNLGQVRREFRTKIINPLPTGDPVDPPQPGVFDLVRYKSQVGDLAAYVSCDPGDGKTHPAVVWIHGGNCNNIGDMGDDSPRDNDQTASQYRKAGIVTMFPSLRGGNQNPGVQEQFLGEVDDVFAAADYLSKLPYVDPDRIYLAGHSCGATLALLVAESSNRFKAVFAFGPVAFVTDYGKSFANPFDPSDKTEVKMRSPAYWLWWVQSPTFVFEGESNPSNADRVRLMQGLKGKSYNLQMYLIPGKTHFSLLARGNEVVARKILATGKGDVVTISESDLLDMRKP